MSIAFGFLFLAGPAYASVASLNVYPSCLPKEIRPDMVASYKNVELPDGKRRFDPITVRQRLKEIGARCSKGNLVDRSRKPVRFYQMKGCWGHPPPDYLKIMERQRQELVDLKKKYTVIEMTCSSGSDPRSIS